MDLLNHRMHQRSANFPSHHCLCMMSSMYNTYILFYDNTIARSTTGNTARIIQTDSEYHTQQAPCGVYQKVNLHDHHQASNYSNDSFRTDLALWLQKWLWHDLPRWERSYWEKLAMKKGFCKQLVLLNFRLYRTR